MLFRSRDGNWWVPCTCRESANKSQKNKALSRQENIAWDHKVAETRGDVLALIANTRTRRNRLLFPDLLVLSRSFSSPGTLSHLWVRAQLPESFIYWKYRTARVQRAAVARKNLVCY